MTFSSGYSLRNNGTVGVVTDDNKLYMAGNSSYYITGQGNETDLSSFTLIRSDVIEGGMTPENTIVKLTNGDLKTWGQGSNGLLGSGNTTNVTEASSAITFDIGTTTLYIQTFEKSFLDKSGLTIMANNSTTNKITLKAPSSGGALNLTLPSSSGTNGQLLKTDGTGTLSFTDVPPATVVTNSTAPVEITAGGADYSIIELLLRGNETNGTKDVTDTHTIIVDSNVTPNSSTKKFTFGSFFSNNSSTISLKIGISPA